MFLEQIALVTPKRNAFTGVGLQRNQQPCDSESPASSKGVPDTA